MLELRLELRLELSARLLALPLLACASLAWAQQYRWADERGRIHYSDTPPPASAKSVERLRLGNIPSSPEAMRAEAARRSPVKLYTSPNCEAPCRDARQLLDQRAVPFAEVAVADDETLAELKRLAGTDKIPALLVGGRASVGFNPELWHAALDAAEYPPAGAVTTATPRALPPVTLYTNSECGALCLEARAWLQTRQVPFTEVPVEEPADVARLRSLTGHQNVPVLTVGKIVQRGYDAGLYARALNAAGY